MIFLSLTFVFVSYSDFQAYARAKKHKTFICKPDSGSQGKGIFLVKSAREVPHGEHIICQVYIAKVNTFLLTLTVTFMVGCSIQPTSLTLTSSAAIDHRRL